MEKKGKKLTIEEIRSIELEILKYVADFCEKHSINYILSDGTLIGAVRHNGFIPWDDDIDISMLREDYNRFIVIWNEDSNHDYYELQCSENNTSCRPFAKIIDNRTCCYENKFIKNSLWIDIFPLDYVPSNRETASNHFIEMKRLSKAVSVLFYAKCKYKLLLPLYRVFLFIRTKDRLFLFYKIENIRKKINELVTSISPTTSITNYMAIFRCPEQRKYGHPATVCSDYMYHKFEKYSFRIPKDFDSLLKSYYGNYMTLPPIEKRVYTHILVAYIKE